VPPLVQKIRRQRRQLKVLTFVSLVMAALIVVVPVAAFLWRVLLG
jgi:hypothetical protein